MSAALTQLESDCASNIVVSHNHIFMVLVYDRIDGLFCRQVASLCQRCHNVGTTSGYSHIDLCGNVATTSYKGCTTTYTHSEFEVILQHGLTSEYRCGYVVTTLYKGCTTTYTHSQLEVILQQCITLSQHCDDINTWLCPRCTKVVPQSLHKVSWRVFCSDNFVITSKHGCVNVVP